MTDEKKPKKKISLTRRISKLKEELEELREKYHKLWDEKWNARRKLELIEECIDNKYYKIKFKMKAANGEHIVECEEIHRGLNVHHAIEVLKINKAKPDTFELLDIKLLGE